MPINDAISASNCLLANLPRTDRRHFLTGCEQVDLNFGKILIEPGERIRHVHFPLNGFISLVEPVDGGANLEVGMIGREGMHGISLVLGVDFSPMRALVQGEGSALRMSAAAFSRELELSQALRRLLNQYICVVLSQLAQTAACTRFHLLEARLARWLLMTQDRAGSEQFYVTQEFMAYMLGVRRVGVTKAASSLQHQNLISYSRGSITILDRDGLQAASCGCDVADRAIYAKIIGFDPLLQN